MHSKLIPSDAITECESNMESVAGGAEEHFSGIDENRTLDSEELQEAALRNTVRRNTSSFFLTFNLRLIEV